MDSEYKKLLPTVVGETKPYWNAAERGQLLIQKCNACSRYQFYPRGFCSHCWSLDIGWVKSSGKGTVWTYTVTFQNRSPGYSEEVPYVVALVELEEGVRMFSNIVECNYQQVSIGMAVQVVFRKATDAITIPYFKRATE